MTSIEAEQCIILHFGNLWHVVLSVPRDTATEYMIFVGVVCDDQNSTTRDNYLKYAQGTFSTFLVSSDR